ncbi:MAG: FAD binding domain-containing protein [bacterium]|nr:FAD binding domain-containing protein [bacterium]
MGVPPFELLEPETVEAASRMLAENGAIPLAGGSAIINLMRQRIFTPERLVSLHRIPGLAEIRETAEGGLFIGAMATLRRIETHPIVRERYPLLAGTLSQVANVRVRGTATLGGNLAHGDYRLDPPGALIALEARLRLGSTRETREMPVADFFTGFFETAKAEDEIILGVELPPPAPGTSGHYLKYTGHASAEWPCMGVAALLRRGEEKIIEDARVVVTAAAAIPLLVEGAGDLLRGERMTEALAAQVGGMGAAQLEPMDDANGSAWYRKEIAPVLIRRALLAAAEG